MQYRGRTEIMKSILEAASGEWTTKTKVMYKAFLSFSQLKDYIALLTSKGLIDYDASRGRFKTTAKGHKFLETYQDIQDLVK